MRQDEPSTAPAGRILARDIAAALVIKGILLALLYLAFFGPSHRVEVTPDRAAQALLDPMHAGH